MAINKAMLAALKALSYPDIDVKKTYKVERQLENLTSGHIINSVLYKKYDHIISCNDHEVPVRVFSPSDNNTHPILLFFHGGGWVRGNIDTYTKVCINMAKITNHKVISVDYRLAPEFPFPAGVEDCYAVAKFLYSNYNKEDITLIGDSAGANMAAAVSLMAKDRGEFLPLNQILIYPSTYNNHTNSSPFPSIRDNGTDYLLTSKRIRDFIELYKSSDEDLNNPYLAPLLAKDLSSQPNTLIITAEFCPLRDEGEYYGKKLFEAGNKVKIYRLKDALHGFLSLPPYFSHVKRTYKIINHFLKEVKN